MALESLKRYQIISDIAWNVAGKIEAEARNVEPNLRRLVLLSNMYDELALKAGAIVFPQDDFLPSTAEKPLAVANDPESELYFSVSSTEGYSSSSEGSDQWDSDDSGDLDTKVSPTYSMYTSPDVTVTVNECYDDDSDDDFNYNLLCYNLAGNFDKFSSPVYEVLSRDIKVANYHFTSIKGDLKQSPIPSLTQPENVTEHGSHQAAKDPQEEVQSSQSRSEKKIAGFLGIRKTERTHVASLNTEGNCSPGHNESHSISEKSMISRLLHGFRPIVA
jgi:hypothetical protein